MYWFNTFIYYKMTTTVSKFGNWLHLLEHQIPYLYDQVNKGISALQVLAGLNGIVQAKYWA